MRRPATRCTASGPAGVGYRYQECVSGRTRRARAARGSPMAGASGAFEQLGVLNRFLLMEVAPACTPDIPRCGRAGARSDWKGHDGPRRQSSSPSARPSGQLRAMQANPREKDHAWTFPRLHSWLSRTRWKICTERNSGRALAGDPVFCAGRPGLPGSYRGRLRVRTRLSPSLVASTKSHARDLSQHRSKRTDKIRER